tara:strand:+ start:1482 stop:1826 length:345 start_codon:yes stop_codon:yes gene_type:complete
MCKQITLNNGGAMIYIMLLAGCFASKKIEFNPTNSMCLDSTVINMEAAGCKAVAVEKTIYGVTKLWCHETTSNPQESPWLTNEFFAIAFGTKLPMDVEPICTDPFLIMTSAEKD